MKKFLFISLAFVINISYGQKIRLAQQLVKSKVKLPNGWSLSPAGRVMQLGDLPLNIAVSTSKKYLAVTNNGQSVQTIQLIDAARERVLHTVIVPKAWYGLKFSSDDKYLYASGGNDNWIMKYAIQDNKLVFSNNAKTW